MHDVAYHRFLWETTDRDVIHDDRPRRRHRDVLYTVCYFIGIFYAVVRQISVLFIDSNDSVFCIRRASDCVIKN